MVKKPAIEVRIREWQEAINAARKSEEIQAALGRPRGVISEHARTISSQKPKSLIRAFGQFGLDPQKPYHTELLCIVLADLLYGERKAGRKKGSADWQLPRLLAWGLAYEEIRAKRPGRLTDKEAAEEIKKNGAFRDTAETIRQNLPAARKHLAQTGQYLEAGRSVTSSPAKGSARPPSGGWLNL
jgi:hypothetical protein